MKRIPAFISLLILVLLPSISRSGQTDVSGDWDLTVTTQRGEMAWEVHFIQDGQNLAVTMKGPRGNEVSGEGTITENALHWIITRSTPRGEITITWSGEVSGETMSGEVQFGSLRTFQWEGAKQNN
jgi:hypothetical protein